MTCGARLTAPPPSYPSAARRQVHTPVRERRPADSDRLSPSSPGGSTARALWWRILGRGGPAARNSGRPAAGCRPLHRAGRQRSPSGGAGHAAGKGGRGAPSRRPARTPGEMPGAALGDARDLAAWNAGVAPPGRARWEKTDGERGTPHSPSTPSPSSLTLSALPNALRMTCAARLAAPPPSYPSAARRQVHTPVRERRPADSDRPSPHPPGV